MSCVDCRWYLPNVLRKFNSRLIAHQKCVEGADMPDIPRPDEIKEIKWNVKSRGCDKFAVFVE